MKQHTGISNRIKSNIRESVPETARKISYSQYSVYKQCPYRWYLTYGKQLFPFTSTIDTVFGTAIHETLQEYITLLYTKSVKASEDFKILTFFKERLIFNYNEEFLKNNEQDFASQEQMKEYYEDGVEIINWVKKKRKVLFDQKDEELLGIEIPLLTPLVVGNDTFFFNGFIDATFKKNSTGKIIVKDFKTSKEGWKDYQKKDELKADQIRLYKRYFSEQFGVPQDDIEVEFVILKRKIWEDSPYPVARVQSFVPAHGTSKVNEAVRGLHDFLHEAFDWEGKVIDKKYLKTPGNNNNNCRFCPYKDDKSLCSKRN